MKVIRDPVHGYIELDEELLHLIDTPEVQRLRRVRQLGLSHLVYPGANHTRFEHSLGTYHLASSFADGEDLGDRESLELRVAALLHDIGHGPFSHVTEDLLEQYLRRNHDNVRELIRDTKVADMLRDAGLRPTRVCAHIRGTTKLGQILSSEIDVDRMDYLIRDSHYTGVAYGTVDHVRLLHEMDFHESKLIVKEGGIQAAESLLVSRFLMHPTVYYHHVSRIAERMLTSGVETLIEEGGLDPNRLQGMDDVDLVARMRAAEGYPREIIDRLDNRRLYKRALYVGFEQLGGQSALKNRGKEKHVEREIAEMAGVNPRCVLVDIPPQPEIPEMKARVMIRGALSRLDEASRIVGTLQEAHWANWRLGVYAPPEHRETVGEAAREFFGVERALVQHKLTDI